MADTLYAGDTMRFTGTFRNSAGAVADPTTVEVRTINEDGTERFFLATDGDVTKDSTGVYRIDVLLDRAGRWKVRFEGTGSLVTHTDAHVDVLDRDF